MGEGAYQRTPCIEPPLDPPQKVQKKSRTVLALLVLTPLQVLTPSQVLTPLQDILFVGVLIDQFKLCSATETR